ncbi:MAG TPA: DUF3293 domain-containing protein [Dyella sp.]|uniref:DUF3293 domain-containing protein n=1 Tax=Dyella sp. TaxID=1869338 RepID=UPI002D76B2A4|nr:DUF3293 domain-containing protein [Dyella sp.]HET6552392.1 DUF3293 domain-containing protein [Dyella sp.]
MDEALLAAYRATEYRVRLSRGGHASLHIGHTPPTELIALIDGQPWSFITAWNPGSLPQPRQHNRHAQRHLLAVLRALPDATQVRAGTGVGADGWREPSLFVVGVRTEALDDLCLQFGQNAYVHGQSTGPARLRLTPGTAHG